MFKTYSKINKPVIILSDRSYESSMLFLVPLLNFLSGINIDLYSPSLPSLAKFFSTSPTNVEYTITATLVGFSIGCLFFAVVFDRISSRKILILSLFAYSLVSFLSIFSKDISYLIIFRVLQGFFVSAISIATRVLAATIFEGKKYFSVLVYMSISYGLGPVIGPSIGGVIQSYLGWKANFIAYALISLLIFIPFFLLLKEPPLKETQSVKDFLILIKKIAFSKTLFLYTLLMTTVLIFQIIYPTFAPFIMQNTFHLSPIFFGYTSLLIGLGYFLGNIANRILLNNFSPDRLINIGIGIVLLGTTLLVLNGFFYRIYWENIVFFIAVLLFGCGFIFSNILGFSLKLFNKNIGTVAAIQSCFLMVFGAVCMLAFNHVKTKIVTDMILIYLITVLLQCLLYGIFYIKNFKDKKTDYLPSSVI